MPDSGGIEITLILERKKMSDKQRRAWNLFWNSVVDEAKAESPDVKSILPIVNMH